MEDVIASAGTEFCPRCKTRKTLAEFFNGNRKKGTSPYCRICTREYAAQYRQKNPGRHADYVRSYRKKHPVRNLIHATRGRAKVAGVPFDLDQYEEELKVRFAAGVCEMSGIPLDVNPTGLTFDALSIDRIDPEKGYVYSNIRIVCFAMNAALGSWGEATLRTIVAAWLAKETAPG